MLSRRSNGFLGLAAFLTILAPAFAQQPKEIRIVANEFSFRPAQIKVSRGEVKITVTNRGKFPHGLAIVGRDAKISYLESGETQSLTLRFDKPEELVFYCPQPGHRKKGMEGKFTIGR